MLFTPRYEPCTECGESLDLQVNSSHLCSDERKLDFEAHCLRSELGVFDDQLAAWLRSPLGSFERWIAARAVRDRPTA